MRVREPILEKEYMETSKAVLAVSKTYPSFQSFENSNDEETHVYKGGIEDNTRNSSNLKKESAMEKEIVVTKPKPSDKKPVSVNTGTGGKQATKPLAKKPEPIKDEDRIDPSQFNDEDLKDPDNLNNLSTAKVLELKQKQVNNEIAKIEGRTPKILRERKVQIACKLKSLISFIEDGTISLDSYITIIRVQLDKDKKLQKYFTQVNDQNKAAIVAERVKLLISELEEGIKSMQGKK